MDQSLPNSLRCAGSSGMNISVELIPDGSGDEFYFVHKSLAVPFQWETEPGRTKSQSELPATIYPLKPPPRLKRPLVHVGCPSEAFTIRHRSFSSKLKRFFLRLLFGTSHTSEYQLLLQRPPLVDEMEPTTTEAHETSSSSAEVSADWPLSESLSHHTTPKRFSVSEIPALQAYLNDRSEMFSDTILSVKASYSTDPSTIHWSLDPKTQFGVSLSASPIKRPKLFTSHECLVEQPGFLPRTKLKLKDILHNCHYSQPLQVSTETCLPEQQNCWGEMAESEFSYRKTNSRQTELTGGEESGKDRFDARPSCTTQHVNCHGRCGSASRRLKAFVRGGFCGSRHGRRRRHRPTQA
eukprot:c22213_g1_i1 orf=645-1700(+)